MLDCRAKACTKGLLFHRHRYLTADFDTKILDFRGFDSSRFSISRVGIVTSKGSFQEMLSQHISVGIIISVGRLGTDAPELNTMNRRQTTLILTETGYLAAVLSQHEQRRPFA